MSEHEAEMTAKRAGLGERWKGRHWPHSWAEVASAVVRDARTDLNVTQSTGDYDRRVLLNVMAFLLDELDRLRPRSAMWEDPDPQTAAGRDLWDRLVNEGYARPGVASVSFSNDEERDIGQRICQIEAEARLIEQAAAPDGLVALHSRAHDAVAAWTDYFEAHEERPVLWKPLCEAMDALAVETRKPAPAAATPSHPAAPDLMRTALEEALSLVTGAGNGTWTRSRPIEEWQRLDRLFRVALIGPATSEVPR